MWNHFSIYISIVVRFVSFIPSVRTNRSARVRSSTKPHTNHTPGLISSIYPMKFMNVWRCTSHTILKWRMEHNIATCYSWKKNWKKKHILFVGYQTELSVLCKPSRASFFVYFSTFWFGCQNLIHTDQTRYARCVARYASNESYLTDWCVCMRNPLTVKDRKWQMVMGNIKIKYECTPRSMISKLYMFINQFSEHVHGFFSL